ncbi:MAG: ABC transporter ATP-binding protein [Bradymonadaceae bacterium]|nr:ABC transporter ATP-binding protein [Lujinxingiaceae bacterium]
MNPTSLSCQGIGHRFAAHTILQDVSLATSPGQSLAIVGPNGAGKTTLLRILSGLLTAASGQVSLGERAVSSLSRREIAHHLAVVPQARPQVFDFSALELVLMGFHARSARFSLPSLAQQTQALATMDRLGIASLANQAASLLSGGELQRTLMARAMVSEAPIWLLDEPTASLDLKHQLTLLEELRHHCQQGGSAIAILHDLALVHQFFDQVAILDANRIVAIGPPDDVLDEQRVSQVFGLRMHRGLVSGRVVWVAG